MNRRIYKKLCKRAMPVLIAKHGYAPRNFTMANGRETLDAPTNMERNDRRGRFFVKGFFSPLKGTPVIWERTSYEYDEWDAKGAVDVLDELEYWESPEAAKFIEEWARETDGESSAQAEPTQ
jgi:hypothetical protein